MPLYIFLYVIFVITEFVIFFRLYFLDPATTLLFGFVFLKDLFKYFDLSRFFRTLDQLFVY